MMNDNDRIALLQVNRELMAHGYVSQVAQAPGYARLYRAAIDGAIPAEQIGRSWSIRRGDLPKVAAVFGLVPASVASAHHAAVEHA